MNTTSSTHPYFTAKAREKFHQAGGDPENAGDLAAWAQQAHDAGDTKQGVVVASDGEIIAHTTRTTGEPSATYVHVESESPWARYLMDGNELSLALGKLRRATGKELIHVTMSDVCIGRAPQQRR